MSMALGLVVGGVATVSMNVAADCALAYDYEYAELSLVSVTVDGVEQTDLTAYTYDVSLEAGEDGASLVVTDAGGVDINSETWQ